MRPRRTAITSEFDPYEELEVARRASDEVIEAAYEALARKYSTFGVGNPDPERMARINAAYEQLRGTLVRQTGAELRAIGQRLETSGRALASAPGEVARTAVPPQAPQAPRAASGLSSPRAASGFANSSMPRDEDAPAPRIRWWTVIVAVIVVAAAFAALRLTREAVQPSRTAVPTSAPTSRLTSATPVAAVQPVGQLAVASTPVRTTQLRPPPVAPTAPVGSVLVVPSELAYGTYVSGLDPNFTQCTVWQNDVPFATVGPRTQLRVTVTSQWRTFRSFGCLPWTRESS